MIIRYFKIIFSVLFFLGFFNFCVCAQDIKNWEQLYYNFDALMPVISFKNLNNDESLEDLKFSKYDISRSYRKGKRSINFVIRDNYLYMLDSSNNVVLFSLDNKKVVKRYNLEGYKNQTASGMAIYEDDLYITFENGTLVSYSLNLLEIGWTVNVVDPINSAPLISNNKVFFVANNTVYAVSLTSRSVLWNHIGSKSGVSLRSIYAPTIYSSYLFLGLSSSDVLLLRQEQGNLFFKTNISNTGDVSYRINPIMGDIKSPIIPYDDSKGTNIIVSSNNRIVMLNLESKSEVWRNVKIGSYSTPIVKGNSIILIDTAGTLTSLSAINGEIQWKKVLTTKVKTKKRIFWYGPIEVNGDLFIANSVGEIMMVSKTDGTLKSYKKLFSFKKEKILSPPVITSEYISVLSSYGNLYINKIKK